MLYINFVLIHLDSGVCKAVTLLVFGATITTVTKQKHFLLLSEVVVAAEAPELIEDIMR
jgi:hypothetical protein